MILLDSGYLIALLVPRDALHEPAVRWSEAVQEKLLLTEYVLWETINYLSPLADRPKAYLLVDEIDGNPAFEFVHASPELFRAGMALHLARADKAWSLTDCISFHIMKERGITKALAYDEHFQQAGFAALLRSEPG